MFTVDAEYEKLIDETALPGDEFRNLRYIARLTLYRLPLADCRKLYEENETRCSIYDCFLSSIIAAQDVPPGCEVCRFPMRDLLAGDFFKYGDYDCSAVFGKSLRTEYARLVELAVSVGYAEQIDALASGVPAAFVFQGDYNAASFALATGAIN